MKALRRPTGALLAAVCCGLAVSGCVVLRPHDDQRMQIAEDAVELVDQLKNPESDPFAAMEENLESVAAGRTEALTYLRDNRKQAFMVDFASMSREDLAEELMTQLGDHEFARSAAHSLIADASEMAKQALERRDRIAEAPPPPDSKLETLLGAVEQRLAFYDDIQAKIGTAMSILREREVEGIASAEAGLAAVDATVASVEKFLNTVEEDVNVKAASQLLLGAGQEVAAAETARLLEMQRHLQALLDIQKELERHDRLYFDDILVPALGFVADDAQYHQAWGAWRGVKHQSFTGDGTRTEFHLDAYPVQASELSVRIDGENRPATVLNQRDDRRVQLRLASPPAAGASIEVEYLLAAPQETIDLKNGCWQREWAPMSLKSPRANPQLSLAVDGEAGAGASSVNLYASELEGTLGPGVTFTIAGDPTIYTTSNSVTADFDLLEGVKFTPELAQPAADQAAVRIILRRASTFREFVELKFAVAEAAQGLSGEDVAAGMSITCEYGTADADEFAMDAEVERAVTCSKPVDELRDESGFSICPKEDQQRGRFETGKFVSQVFFVLFVESVFDQEQSLALAAERHRNSIRVARINAGERLDLVGQIAAALRIYYQGGITPQEVLIAANALATFFIGSQI